MFLSQSKSCALIYCLSSFISLGWLYSDVAKAENTPFIFQGSVDGICEFRDIIGGSLGLSSDGKTFDSEESGGSQASATFFCNGRATVQADAPVLLGASDPLTINSSRAEVRLNRPILPDETIIATNNSTPSSSGTLYPSFLFFFIEYDVEVDMRVTSDEKIPAGNYIFTVRLTASPI